MERINKLESLLILQPNDCFLMHALGLEYIKLGDIDIAIKYFNNALSTDENYVGTYYHLAKAYESKQHIELAISTYEKGIEIAINVKDNHAKNELQMALEDLDDM
jgi:Tfp pilus assembly protein PilF